MPATAVAPRRTDPNSPFADVPEAQSLLSDSVNAYGRTLQPAVLKDVGDAFAGLNSIGALRSGGAEVALGDISTKYGAMVGNYASMTAGKGLDAGMEAHRQRFVEAEAARARKAATLKAIGAILGAGIGFAASGGNPLGARAGSQIGGSIGGNATEKAYY